jgi:hypothetical protein
MRAPLFQSSLELRLVALRRRQELGANGVAWISSVLGCMLSGYLAYFFGLFFFVGVSALSSGSDPAGAIFALVMVIGLLGVGGGAGAWYLTRWGAQRLIARYHAQTWYELHETNFMTLVADDSYTKVITERIEHVWSLRWISPPPPRNLEEQLEFAACYQLALRRMLGGVGRLENGPLWQGGMTWYAGGTRGFTCGCLALAFLGGIGVALVVVGAIFHLQRCAALIAYCDFLLYDERMRRHDGNVPATSPGATPTSLR